MAKHFILLTQSEILSVSNSPLNISVINLIQFGISPEQIQNKFGISPKQIQNKSGINPEQIRNKSGTDSTRKNKLKLKLKLMLKLMLKLKLKIMLKLMLKLKLKYYLKKKKLDGKIEYFAIHKLFI